jgi:Ca-activated chloride channel family protein
MGARADHHAGLAVLVAVLSLAAADSEASTQRLVLDRANPPASAEVLGLTEISVIPPFEGATVSILLDGKMVSTSTAPPYRVEIDFGPRPLEHRISVVAKSRDGKKRNEWSHVINRGNRPLSVAVTIESSESSAYLEAAVTSPREDPIVSVEFFDGSVVIGRLTQAPYRISLPAGNVPPVLFATARTRSGAEETDFLTSVDDHLVESFQLRTVPIYVSVVDQKGSAKRDLKRANFKVLDNGRETRILDFSPAFNEPISIALLLDASGSMAVDIEGAVGAAKRFVKDMLRPKDRLAVFAIRDVPRREIAITNDWKSVDEKLTSLQTYGNTAVWDAIASASRELANEKNRRAIVVFTDGQDNASVATFDDTLEHAKRAGIPVYVIVYGTPELFGRAIDQMKLLAADTGGFVTFAATNNLHQKYAQIANDLRAQYAIRYQIGDNAKSNQWRAVKVVLNSRKLTARTIKGYFTP